MINKVSQPFYTLTTLTMHTSKMYSGRIKIYAYLKAIFSNAYIFV